MKSIYLLLAIVSPWLGAIPRSVLAAETAAEGAPANRNSPPKFVRLVRDSHGHPQALQSAMVRYAAVGGEKQSGLIVDLIGAVHVGEKSYYRQLEREFDRYDVVLYELVAPANPPASSAQKQAATNGPVKPRQNASIEPALGAVGALQNGMKNFLQLEHQLEHINYGRSNFVHADMNMREFTESMANRGESFLAMFLSLMIKSMAEQKQGRQVSDLEMLVALLSPERALVMKRLMAEQFDRLEGALDQLGGPKGSTILTERNKVAMNVLLGEIAKGRKRIAIFYGAAHMPDFEARLAQELGLRRTFERWLTAWDLRPRGARTDDAETR